MLIPVELPVRPRRTLCQSGPGLRLSSLANYLIKALSVLEELNVCVEISFRMKV